MKKLLDLLRNQPALSSLLIFVAIIIPSLLVFPAAENNSQVLVAICLGLVVLANLAAVIPPLQK
jgi:hypothetical protein